MRGVYHRAGQRPDPVAYCALRRRQERKRLPRAAAAEIEFGCLLDGDRVHASERRPVSALLDEFRYFGGRTGYQNLNRAVEAVADPTVEAEPPRPSLRPIPETQLFD